MTTSAALPRPTARCQARPRRRKIPDDDGRLDPEVAPTASTSDRVRAGRDGPVEGDRAVEMTGRVDRQVDRTDTGELAEAGEGVRDERHGARHSTAGRAVAGEDVAAQVDVAARRHRGRRDVDGGRAGH